MNFWVIIIRRIYNLRPTSSIGYCVAYIFSTERKKKYISVTLSLDGTDLWCDKCLATIARQNTMNGSILENRSSYQSALFAIRNTNVMEIN